MTEEKRTELNPLYISITVLVVVLALLFGGQVLLDGVYLLEWRNTTELRAALVTGPSPDVFITATPADGSRWSITCTYNRGDEARVSIYESPWKSGLIPIGMTKFYDRYEWGPFRHTFTAGGCGSIFVAVNSVFTGEGEWRELQPLTLCV